MPNASIVACNTSGISSSTAKAAAADRNPGIRRLVIKLAERRRIRLSENLSGDPALLVYLIQSPIADATSVVKVVCYLSTPLPAELLTKAPLLSETCPSKIGASVVDGQVVNDLDQPGLRIAS